MITPGDLLAILLSCFVMPAIIPVAAGLVFYSVAKALLDD